ncbi:uncharacterized protein [Miscanthus floridulus]|uniref:uncharacterized protein isoform X2 n=1 Tax=Miscanthus floridulus TaxID=154761 RepID=UPI0034579CDB
MESQRVVVVVEDAAAARSALQWAVGNFIRSSDSITLLHVCPPARSRRKRRRLRLGGFQLALAFKDLCNGIAEGAEPVQQSPEPGLQGARRPAARHGAGRLLERRAHPDRDRQLAHTTAKDPVPDVHASPWRDMEKIEAEKVTPAAAAVRRRVEDDGAPSVSVGGTARQADAG